MKALEKIKDMIDFCDAIGCHRALYESLKAVEEELEALQQHRSCESCVHRSSLDETLTNKVTNGFCIENGFFTKVGFCCNRYEPKEQ